MSSEDEGKVISIASGKGGTGKTVSTLNIAMTLHNLGEDVLVIDADLKDPNIGINLGIYAPQSTVNEALEEEKNLLEALYIHDSGLRVIPASLSINYLNSNLKSFSKLTRDMGGYVLIDCGPGLSEDVISCLKASDSVIPVTNPMRSALSGTIRLVELAQDLDREIEGIIVNNLTSKEISLEEIRNITGCPILGDVPYDTNVDRSIVNRRPLVEHKPHSSAAQEFQKIAHDLAGEDYTPQFSNRFKRFVDSVKSFVSLE
ncbi:MAG: P-loop NTPase [Candidatus Aenigmatarchaeota archaeon]